MKSTTKRRKNNGNVTPSVPPSRAQIRRARVLVVGDVMLDRYWFGDVSRISPEAPVPVVKIDRVEERLGGAANVARNAAALGVKASLLSVVGRDEAGRRLRQLLKSERIAASLEMGIASAQGVVLRRGERYRRPAGDDHRAAGQSADVR